MAFPRIHTLAVIKDGVVREFGWWNRATWHWKIDTRRPILGWEESVWTCFIKVVEHFRMMKPFPDILMWSLVPSGQFSMSSFRRELEFHLAMGTPSSPGVMVWSGFVPPKVDLFMWMVAKGRLLMGDLLPKFTSGVLGCQLCPLCKDLNETIDHLFVRCKAGEMVRRRIGWWFKYCGPGSSLSLVVLMLNLKEGCVDSWNVKNADTILDIKEIIKRGLKVSVHFAPRYGNVATDLLAKLGSLSGLTLEGCAVGMG
ncbi:hypothetical protein Q3G72_015484 [Acer saccharum]|nr:hypothetical protein Q3G72_015484 [Acer saccharum]